MIRLPQRLTRALYLQLIQRVASRRPPDFIVGADAPGGAYLLRWYLTPWRKWYHHVDDADKTRWQRFACTVSRWLPNPYLHCFLRDDDDRALHDHPSCALSLMLHGSYIEHTIAAGGIHRRQRIEAGTLRFMRTRHTHRIELVRLPTPAVGLVAEGFATAASMLAATGMPVTVTPAIPCWTLFMFGPTVRHWGFHCPDRGWVHWRDFTAAGKPGEIGPGCGA